MIEKIPFFLVMLSSAVIAYISQDQTGGTLSPVEQGGYGIIFYKMAYNVVLYLQHMVYPTGLTSHYPIPDPFNLSNPAVLWTCVTATVIVGFIVYSLRHTQAIFAGWLYAMVVLLPASGIIGFNNVIGSDKYMYFPLLGYLMILCWAIGAGYDRLFTKRSDQRVIRMGAVAVPLVLAASYLIYLNADYVAKWKDTETLYTYMLGIAPKAAPMHYDLAMEYTRQKRLPDAVRHYELAAQYDQNNNWIQTNLGIAYYDSGMTDKAIAAFNRALVLQPNDAFAANNLGIVYMKKNDDVNALSWFIKAVKIKPDFFDAVYYQGKMYDKLGMMDLAMGSFQQAYRLNPGVPELHYDMGRMFEKKGMKEQALLMFQQVKQMQSDFPGIDEKLRMTN